MMLKRITVLLFGVLCYSLLWAQAPEAQWFSVEKDRSVVLNVELFLSSECSHCHKADDFFKSIESPNPWLKVHRHLINQDKAALNYFYELLSAQHLDDFAVPSVFFCNSRWMGFSSDETTGKELLASMRYCKQQIEKQGHLSPSTSELLKKKANASFFDSSMTGNPSPLYYILWVAMLDAFSPCTYFGFLGFLAFLFTQSAFKKRVSLGFCYLIPIVGFNFFQRVDAALFYEWFNYARIPSVMIGFWGLGALYQMSKKGLSFANLCLLALAMSITIQWHQQTCVMSWSLVFEQWFSSQKGLGSQYELYYELVYMVPLMMTLVVSSLILSVNRVSQHADRLEYFARVLILLFSLIFIIYPKSLSSVELSVFIPMLSFIITWIAKR